MREKTKRLVSFAVALCLLAGCFIPQATAYAAGVSVSSKSCEVGDTVSVTVKFSQTNIGAVGANFTYDSSILQYKGGSGTSGGGGSGKIVLTGSGGSSVSTTITFKALKAGTSTIKVSAYELYTLDSDDNLAPVSGSGKVTVKAAVVSTPKPTTKTKTPTSPATPTPTPSAMPSIPVTVDGATLYIARDLSEITLPEDFTVSEITYQSDTIPAAVRSDGKLTLVYLTDSDGQSGAFYILDGEASAFYRYISLAASGTYTVLQLPSSVSAPDGYQQADLVISDQTVIAWQQSSGQNPAFYLLYVMNPEGEAGFYLYDTQEGTIQRYADRSVELSPTPTPVVQKTLVQTVKDSPALLILFGTLLVLCIVLSVLLIVMSRKRRAVRQDKYLLHDETQEPKE